MRVCFSDPSFVYVECPQTLPQIIKNYRVLIVLIVLYASAAGLGFQLLFRYRDNFLC